MRGAIESAWPLVAVLCLLFGTGCVTLGKAGVLGFDYEARDRILGRDAPSGAAVAVGGHVDLNVYSQRPPPARPGDELDGLGGVTGTASGRGFDRVAVLRALSSIPEVARLEELPDGGGAADGDAEGAPRPGGVRVRVHGQSAGQADISVETALGGDTVTVSVAEVASATLDHWLFDIADEGRSSVETAFVRGGTGRFFLSMRDASGRAVVGAGVVPPIVVAPAGAASLAAIAEGDLRHAEIRFDGAGQIDLGMVRRDPLRVAVIEASSVTALEIVALDLKKGVARPPAGVREGEWLGVAVRGVLEGDRRILLLGDVARVASSTPDVCTAPADLTRQVRLAFGDGAVAVRAAAPGACTLVATLGALRAEATFPVAPAEPPAPASPPAGESAPAPASPPVGESAPAPASPPAGG